MESETMKDKNVVLITGGGTGGHLSIAKVLIDQFKLKNIKVIYVGSTNGQDKKWFENYTNIDESYFFKTQGVVNQGLFGKLKSLYLILKATLNVISIIKKNKVTKVISVGGYSASAASFAALITKKDFYIHEQNSVMGKLNQISSKWAKEIFGSYDNATYKIDYPIDKKYFQIARVRTSVKKIIFLGGSQGSVAINKFAIKNAKYLIDMGYEIIHQAGIKHIKNVQDEYKKQNINVDSFGFTNNLLDKLNSADIAICRAGAGTIWELSALGIPALYIPYPYAAANHQYYNAKFIEDKNLGKVVNENNISINKLMEFINSDIENKSRGLISLIKPDGISKMLNRIISD
jgi:UDP-N-acetylglucosamine--N-acetylmuramyl-(pentapeptide) pyrophosphoryl-undecaprenol N-acetylglucosamine transferase